MTILVAEDFDDTRVMMRMLLEPAINPAIDL
jgi:hypothetical protein